MSIEARTGDLCPHHSTPTERRCSGCGIPYCDRCLVPLKDQWLCAACKHKRLSSNFKVIGVAAQPAVTGNAAPLGSPCSTHPDEAAYAICERCGDFMCALCTTPFEGRYYCVKCFDLQWGRGGLHAPASPGPGTGQFSVILGLGALLCFWIPPINLICAIGAGALSTAALMGGKPEQRGSAIAGAVMAVLGFGVMLLWALQLR